MTTNPMRDRLAIALWAATGFGFAEGALHLVLRNYPALQAAHKLGPEALWIAPVANLPVALGLALALTLLARRWAPAGTPAFAMGVFTAAGMIALLRAPGVLHPASVVLLGAGAGVMVFRSRRLGNSHSVAGSGRALALIPLLILLSAGAVALAGRWAEARRAAALPAAPADRPDVLILLLDTVRRDRFTGATRLTPGLDSLAAEGASFSNAWAPSSWSLPSQASILTGRHAHLHGADWPTLRLHDSIPTLAEAFRDAGYTTGAFSSNNSWTTPEYLGRGFVRFTSYLLEDQWERTGAGRLVAGGLRLLGRRPDRPMLEAPHNISRFLEFVDENPGRPVFAYLCFMDVNRAFYDRLLSRPFWRPRTPMASAVAAYDRELASLDGQIRELLGALSRRGRLERTVVVVTSDHGESFGAAHDEDHDPKGHGTSLYPEQVRVPLYVVAPGRVPRGAIVAPAVGLVDLPGLALELAGIQDARFPQGPAIAQLEAPGSADSIGSAFATLDYDRFSARTAVRGTLQYLVTRRGPEPGERLFDLATDSLARASLPPTDARWPELRRLLAEYRPADPPPEADRDAARR